MVRMPGDRHTSQLCWMLILPMATARLHEIPTVSLNNIDHFAYFHEYTLIFSLLP